MQRVVAAGRDPRAVRVRDVMTSEVLCCRLLTDIDEVAALMQSQRIRHLPIIDANDDPTGMISIGDINAFNVQHKQATIENLADYIYGRG
jgi:CBS domain-containing protein